MPPKKTTHRDKQFIFRILVLLGILVIVAVILIVKDQNQKPIEVSGENPEVQLDRYLAEERPVLVFFHSNNCQSCIDMIHIIDEVYPTYKDQVALVDVNVYDPINENLLRRAQINSIPTQVFIDNTGQGRVSIGVMTQDQLRQQLQALSGNNGQ